jgi:hypothetical protein
LAKDADLQSFLATNGNNPVHVGMAREELAGRINRVNPGNRRLSGFTAGGHVNTANVFGISPNAHDLGKAQGADRSPGDKNCALCATAGCINLALGHVQTTTGQIAAMLGATDSFSAYGNSRDEQLKGILAKTTSHLPERVHMIHGTDEKRLTLNDALNAMRSYPDGTIFVVSCTGALEGMSDSWSHWTNAIKKRGAIVFVDFQSDNANRAGCAFISDRPALGIFGKEFVDPMTQVIAYPLKPKWAKVSNTTVTNNTTNKPQISSNRIGNNTTPRLTPTTGLNTTSTTTTTTTTTSTTTTAPQLISTTVLTGTNPPLPGGATQQVIPLSPRKPHSTGTAEGRKKRFGGNFEDWNYAYDDES